MLSEEELAKRRIINKKIFKWFGIIFGLLILLVVLSELFTPKETKDRLAKEAKTKDSLALLEKAKIEYKNSDPKQIEKNKIISQLLGTWKHKNETEKTGRGQWKYTNTEVEIIGNNVSSKMKYEIVLPDMLLWIDGKDTISRQIFKLNAKELTLREKDYAGTSSEYWELVKVD